MELAPFRAAIADGVPAIMTAHILFPALDDSGVPATMSRRIVTGLLRGEMSFTGLVTSDCMEMQAVQKFFGSVNGVLAAMNAGVDLVLLSHTTLLSGEAPRLPPKLCSPANWTAKRWKKVWTAFWPLRPSWPPCPPPRLMRSGPPPE